MTQAANASANTNGQRLFDCIVTGTKPFYGTQKRDNGSIRRVIAQPGDFIQATAQQMRAFPHRLTTPGVAKAQALAQKALEEGQAALDEALAVDMAPTPPETVESLTPASETDTEVDALLDETEETDDEDGEG